jgi:hypothetical protein
VLCGGAKVGAMKMMQRKTVKVSKTSAPLEAKMSASPKAVAMPTYEAIAKRSYELFLARGGESGRDVEDWLQAEADLRKN